MFHQPVLLEEVLEYLDIKPDGYYVDGTFGRGGHSVAILQRLGLQGHLLAIDRDMEAIEAGKNLAALDSRLELAHTNFSNLNQLIYDKGWLGKVNGILLDLGVSSPQLESPQRGFSFLHDGPLDMRMNPHEQHVNAAQWLRQATEQEIAIVLKELGEERYAKRIARAIVLAQKNAPIERTGQLSAIVAAANPKWEQGKHPATRSFMAIRLHINKELESLNMVLQQFLDMLIVSGRILVISFHSLEDRLVKQCFKKLSTVDSELPRNLPVITRNLRPKARLFKAIRPSLTEINANPRSRSAILRVLEKI
jgi:16S rRNA (cytosine1402-N4)-methyltransferase